MAHLIDKDAVMAEIERTQKRLNIDDIGGRSVMAWSEGFKNFIDTLKVKEVDLEKEKDDYWNKLCDSEFGELLERDAKWFDDIAKHFFELGLSVKNPITTADRGMVEEIIIILKRLEKDYHIDLNVETAVSLVIREMERLRNLAQK